MGYYEGWGTKKSLVKHLLEENGPKTIVHSLIGTKLWAVQEWMHTSERFIVLYKIGYNRSNSMWGYRSQSEGMGPYDYACPLTFLNMVPDPGGYATDWRKRNRDAHAKQLAQNTFRKRLVVGAEIVLKDNYTPQGIYTIQSIKPLRAWGPNGKLFRIGPKAIKGFASDNPPPSCEKHTGVLNLIYG